MKQKDRQKKIFGAAGFDQYYADLFGERWQTLKAALQAPPDYIEWRAGGAESYFLDSASVRAALSLPLAGAKHLLDMCAAPGGKTLVLASLMPSDATLLSNERSVERKNRLAHVCDSCLPPSVRARVTVTNHDGAKMCQHQRACFDAILLDAPCSSERHVFADQKYLAEWSPSRSKTLSVAQWSLVSSAWRMLKAGGFLLYATCALAPAENDAVIARLLKKFPDATRCAPLITTDAYHACMAQAKPLPSSEETPFGAQILPDTAAGAGPLYFSLIKKDGKII